MKKHYETHVEDTDKLISVAGPILEYKSWYEQYRKLMEEQAQRKYGLYTPTSEGDDDDFPSIPGMIARYSALGLTNEQMAANPVWVDKTGNGHDLQMKNFLWGGMSGVGGYNQNFNQYFVGVDESNKTVSDSSMKLVLLESDSQKVIYDRNSYQIGHTYNFYIKVTGIEGRMLNVNAGTLGGRIMSITEDGIYSINVTVSDSWGQNRLYLIFPPSSSSNTVTIEQLPLYPGALIFDGVDDYGTCDNFPILTKEKGYTVVALRQYLVEKSTAYLTANGDSISNTSFIFEGNNYKDTWNFGRVSTIQASRILATQTSKQYDGVKLNIGTNAEGSNLLQVGKWSKSYSNVAIWELVFLDHDATEEELTKIKDYFVKTYPWLFFDQAWTVTGKTNEDKDRATIANITGNGNDLILSNFGFAEGSGYGLYAQNYISYAITNRAVYTKTNSSIHVTKSITAGVNFTESARDVTIPSYRIKVTGIQSGQEMIYRGSNNTFLTNIPSDGIYVLPAVENGSNLGFQFVSYTGDCDITIEQIPEYEGYLITDGVDDEIISAKLIQFADKFTIVGDWKFMEDRNDNAGLLKANQIYIYNATTGMRIYLKQGSKNYPFSCKKINALTSDGWVYDEKWDKYKVYPIGSDIDISSRLFLGFYSSNFTKIALKNLGIYNDQLLSKDDCIKAYNYLQTLKSK